MDIKFKVPGDYYLSLTSTLPYFLIDLGQAVHKTFFASSGHVLYNFSNCFFLLYLYLVTIILLLYSKNLCFWSLSSKDKVTEFL
jgi:hypothetical protein